MKHSDGLAFATRLTREHAKLSSGAQRVYTLELLALLAAVASVVWTLAAGSFWGLLVAAVLIAMAVRLRRVGDVRSALARAKLAEAQRAINEVFAAALRRCVLFPSVRGRAATRKMWCHDHGQVVGLIGNHDLGMGPVCVRCFRALIPDVAERRFVIRQGFLTPRSPNASISAEAPRSDDRVTAVRQSTLSPAPRPLPTSSRDLADGTGERFPPEAQ